jgi:predicted lipoprotein
VRPLFALVATALLFSCKVATVRPLPSGGRATAPGARAFDGPAWVESIWSSRVLPTIEQEAADCAALLASLKGDPDGTRKRLGRGPRGPAYFVVKGQGTVVAVDRG